MSEFVYDAFISYSHRDLDWGRRLQKSLESFHIPKNLAGELMDRSRLRVFRDQTDLAGAELQASLQRELERSRFLIVLCSPHSAASKWVDEEVRYFCSLGRKDRIIPFIIDGEPMSSDPELECFTPTLRGPETNELLGVNIQEIGKKKAILKVISVLLDVRFNRLVDRDRIRRRRTALIAGSVAAAALLITGGLLYRNLKMDYDFYTASIAALQMDETLQPEIIARLDKSAKLGNTDAIWRLAHCYEFGYGIPKNPDLAFYWYKRGADKGDVNALIGLSHCYLEGIGTEPNKTLFFSTKLQAAEAGDPESMVDIGNFYVYGGINKSDPVAGFQWYQRAAESGSTKGMQNLGISYIAGTGTEKDPELGFSWICKAAELGDPETMFLLGIQYLSSEVVPPDPEKAYYWFRKAAEEGQPRAMYYTGFCIENNIGVTNPALDWYKKAAEAGVPEAQERLAALAAESQQHEPSPPPETVSPESSQ